jgi:ribosome biogenesis GTPase
LTVEGLVVKAWSDWFEVQTDAERLACQPRGILRRNEGGVVVGDRVTVRPLSSGQGRIEAVAPRRNLLARPPVANVDRVAVVSAWAAPPWNPGLVDRFLVLAGIEDCTAAVVLNKVDLLPPAERDEALEALKPYAAAGYAVFATSAVTREGLDELAAFLQGGLAVLAGQSGVGKSHLLAALTGREVRTGRLSERIGRGRHTTRHVELLALPQGGRVADTPGFQRLALRDLRPADLRALFPDVDGLAHECRFRGCMHREEPGCAVRAAVEAGRLDAGRYDRYRRCLAELEEQEAHRY